MRRRVAGEPVALRMGCDRAPTRSLELKVIVPRSPDRLRLARAVWTTNRAVNEATRHHVELLLLLRGGG